MQFIQEWGERNGRPMGCDERPIITNDPHETCVQRIAFLTDNFSIAFDSQSRPTDGIKVCIFEKPDDWEDRKVRGEAIEVKPVFALAYDRSGLRKMTPARLIF